MAKCNNCNITTLPELDILLDWDRQQPILHFCSVKCLVTDMLDRTDLEI